MKVQIKHEHGYEEVLRNDIISKSIVTIIFGSIWALLMGISKSLILIGSISIFIILFLLEERITFNKGINSVIIEKRTINKKLKLEWVVAKKIRFSDIKCINVIEQSDGEGGNYYQTELIVFEYIKNILSDGNSECAKNSAIKICKATGVNGYYIDNKNNPTKLDEASSKSIMLKHQPENEPISKDLHNQTLRLEQGWE